MNQSSLFQVFPQVVQADRTARIILTPVLLLENADQEQTGFRSDMVYRLLHVGLQIPGETMNQDAAVSCQFDPEKGVLAAELFFAGEQEHQLRLYAGQPDYDQPLAIFSLYSVGPDLFERIPCKGDLHIHSRRSDGLDEPAHVAAACRRIGLDFMAVTDHSRYGPSIEAQSAFAGVPVDLLICRGEEVHAPGNPLHIINFGGRFSINEQFGQPDYAEKIAEVDRRLGDLPAAVDRYEYASAVWIFDQIRLGGGLGIFCHPYWLFPHKERRQGYYISEALISQLFAGQPYDALELLGGYHLHEAESNNLQVARYQDERAQGRRVPIVGVSDAHGCENGKLFGWYYTLVFSRGNSQPDLIEGIRSLYSVAVEALPGEIVRAYGPFRLVKFALFLLREVFPAHDAYCCEEGKMMLAMADAADAAATQRLMQMHGRTAALMDRVYGRQQALS